MSKPLHGLRDGFGPVLVGMRGSGKSSVAPLLAERLQMKAIDADAELELRAGRSIPTIFAEDGEPEFRRIERTLLLDDLLRRNDTVIATGGGAVLDSEVRERLRQRLTVWLHAPVDVLARRIGGSDRPSLTGKSDRRRAGRGFSQARGALPRCGAAGGRDIKTRAWPRSSTTSRARRWEKTDELQLAGRRPMSSNSLGEDR
jgi:shikimate kinase